MILNRPTNFVDGMVPADTQAFKIAASGHLMDILSNLIYKDKLLAVIRELSCNAYDAHVAAKNPAPFKVQVPTKLDPTFAVEDEGVGLPEDKIGDIFWTYGASTKTNTNDQIGALGIGSKSPFAYTKSSFIVRSRFDGVETEYLCFINKAGVPEGAVTRREATDLPNGVRVELGVRAEDVSAFQARMIQFFRYWKVKPTLINGGDIDWSKTKPLLEGNGWWFESHESEDFTKQAKAIMGNVAYPINYSAIPSPSEELRFVSQNAFIIDFKLGDLAFAASREELSYDNNTIKNLEAGAKRVMKEFYAKLRSEINEYKGTPLDMVTRHQSLISQLERTFGYRVIERAQLKQASLTTADGVTISAREAMSRELSVTTETHSSLVIYDLARSTAGNIRLKQAREITLTKMEPQPAAMDGTPRPDKERTRHVPWFSPTVKAKKTLKGGTVGDFLADGYAFKSCKLPLQLPRYGTVDQWAADKDRLVFVVNDAGAKGSIGIRAYFQDYARRETMHRFVFVDYDGKVAPADLGVAELEGLLKGSIAEGARIVPLTKLPGFVMPKDEPRVAKPTTPQGPRGWVEVRRVTFSAQGEEQGGRFGSHRSTFKGLTETDSQYVKVDPANFTSLYTLSAPGGMEKNIRSLLMSAKVCFAFHAGLLDKWVTKDAAGERQSLNLIVRNADDIESLKKKGALLTDVSQMLTTLFDGVDFSAVKDHMEVAREMTNKGVLYPSVRRKLAPLLASDSYMTKVLNIVAGLTTFFEKNPTRVALANLANIVGKEEEGQCELFEEASKRYPLLRHLNDVRDSDFDVESLAAYIAMEDKRNAAKAAAQATAQATAALAAAATPAPAAAPVTAEAV